MDFQSDPKQVIQVVPQPTITIGSSFNIKRVTSASNLEDSEEFSRHVGEVETH